MRNKGEHVGPIVAASGGEAYVECTCGWSRSGVKARADSGLSASSEARRLWRVHEATSRKLDRPQ